MCVHVCERRSNKESEAGISVVGHKAWAKGPEAGQPLECVGQPLASSSQLLTSPLQAPARDSKDALSSPFLSFNRVNVF